MYRNCTYILLCTLWSLWSICYDFVIFFSYVHNMVKKVFFSRNNRVFCFYVNTNKSKVGTYQILVYGRLTTVDSPFFWYILYIGVYLRQIIYLYMEYIHVTLSVPRRDCDIVLSYVHISFRTSFLLHIDLALVVLM